MMWNEKAGKEIELTGIEYIYIKENTELEGK